ncbi:MAG: helix-turn-helix transcriptional regulator [Marinicellaceae bacterium]
MLWIDAFFRFSGVGLLLLSIPMVLMVSTKNRTMLFLLLAQTFLLIHLLGFTPAAFYPPDFLRQLLRMIDVGLLISIWFFVLSLFKQGFKASVMHVGFGVFVVSIMLAERLVQFGHLESLPTWWAHMVNASAFLIIFHMIYVSLTGHTDDLIEVRRKTRIKMMALVAVSATIMIVLGSVLLPEFQPTINAISLWPVLFALSFWVFNLDYTVFAFDSVSETNLEKLSPREKQLHDELMRLTEKDKFYLQNNITINSLSQYIGIGVSKLRTHINQHMGFDNFSRFINELRINDIKLALKDRENSHIPILTIALNHGFNSLPPFNRAFKKIVGQTPTEFRKIHTK